MAKIIVCYKWVLDEADIFISRSDLSVDTSKAKGKISDYDKNAIEAAVRIGHQTSDQVVALTYGDAGTKVSLKDALSRGPQLGVWVNHDAAKQSDGFVTANVLAAAIKKMGDYRLIVCGDGAADTFAHQVGSRIGTILGIPVITNVNNVRIEGDNIIAVRKLENSFETVKAPLPVLITVLPEINPAPIPGLKAVLDAGKKTSLELKPTELELENDDLLPKSSVKFLHGYEMNRKNVLFSGGPASDMVKQLVSELKREGVL